MALAAVAPDVLLPRPFAITRYVRDTHDTFTIELEPADGGGPITFEPGQFNMLYAMGVGEVPISISGDPAKPEKLVHTIRAVGPVTKAMQAMGKGDMIGVRGPYGSAWPMETARGNDLLVIAGGIGLAPLRPAIYWGLAHRQELGRLVILYGTRTPHDMLFRKELEKWRGRLDVSVRVTVDRAEPGWKGNVGVVTTLIPRAGFDPVDVVALVCGPEVMMRFCARELVNHGVSPDRIFLSQERNMKCGVGLCGRCQYGPTFVCKDGPVFSYERVSPLLGKREL
ncbi:MAG: FAD/NAD(P)-binding protein [Fimbriimonadia bacterium]|jgi:NAD(P)H-flavin reductase